MKKATDAATPQAFSRFVAVGLLSIPFQTNVRNAKASEALTKQTMAGPNSSHCAMAIPGPNGSPHSTSTEIEASHWRTILHDALTLTFTHTFAFDLGILRAIPAGANRLACAIYSIQARDHVCAGLEPLDSRDRELRRQPLGWPNRAI